MIIIIIWPLWLLSRYTFCRRGYGGRRSAVISAADAGRTPTTVINTLYHILVNFSLFIIINRDTYLTRWAGGGGSDSVVALVLSPDSQVGFVPCHLVFDAKKRASLMSKSRTVVNR